MRAAGLGLECIIMKFITIVIISRFYIAGQGQESDQSCVPPVKNVYRREHTDAHFQFDVSGNLPQQPDEIRKFRIAFNDRKLLAYVKYKYPESIEPVPEIDVTIHADVTGNIEMTMANVSLNNSGTYRVYDHSGILDCSFLYILGIPTKPTISGNNRSHLGGKTTFACRSSSTTFPSNHSLTFMYNWKVDNVDNPTDSRYHYSTNRNTLTLSNLVQEDASKKFTCSATEVVIDGYTTRSSKPLIPNLIHGPDKPIISVQSPYNVREDDTPADITCSSSCFPGCTYSWTNVTSDTVISKTSALALGTVNRYTAGSYKCTVINLSPAYRKTAEVTLTVTVKSSPRPLHQVQQNISTILSAPVTLSFTVLAYPEPGFNGFTWHKEYNKNRTPLLSNADLLISSSGLQSNLTIRNVSQADYGQYRVTVVNVVGKYKQSLNLSEGDELHRGKEVNENESDNTAKILAYVLGAVCVVLIVYATYLTILHKRKATSTRTGTKPPEASTNQTTYTNMSYKPDARENEEVDKDAPSVEEESDKHYTDLVHISEKDKDTYEVIQTD